MKCENCIWAVWYYSEVVECCGGPCPSEADFEAAEKIGCLAMDGIAEAEDEAIDIAISALSADVNNIAEKGDM